MTPGSSLVDVIMLLLLVFAGEGSEGGIPSREGASNGAGHVANDSVCVFGAVGTCRKTLLLQSSVAFMVATLAGYAVMLLERGPHNGRHPHPPHPPPPQRHSVRENHPATGGRCHAPCVAMGLWRWWCWQIGGVRSDPVRRPCCHGIRVPPRRWWPRPPGTVVPRRDWIGIAHPRMAVAWRGSHRSPRCRWEGSLAHWCAAVARRMRDPTVGGAATESSSHFLWTGHWSRRDGAENGFGRVATASRTPTPRTRGWPAASTDSTETGFPWR